jgi:hypothetical protein
MGAILPAACATSSLDFRDLPFSLSRDDFHHGTRQPTELRDPAGLKEPLRV